MSIPIRRRHVLTGMAGMASTPFFSVAQAAGATDVSALVTAAGSNPLTSTLTVKRMSDGRVWQSNSARADVRFSPASTSKVPHTLIALETGAATPDTVFAWDGKKRWLDAWNRDQTLTSAFGVSAVWVYQELARQQGHDTMALWIDQFGYGNRDIGGADDLTSYWLNGRLRTSALDQVDFLSRLVAGDLPVSRETMQTGRSIMRADHGDGWALFAKSGWYHHDERMDIGWYVGWTERADETYVFAFNLDMPSADLRDQRVDTPIAVLGGIGALGVRGD